MGHTGSRHKMWEEKKRSEGRKFFIGGSKLPQGKPERFPRRARGVKQDTECTIEKES